MKLTKKTLRELIKEELQHNSVLSESEAAKKIKAADDALQITREKMAEQEAINEKALAEADRKAQEELANAKQDAEKKQTASEEAIAVAEAEKTKTEVALRKAENDMISAEKEQEITNKAEKKKQLLIGGSILMGLVLFVIILIIRRKKKKIKFLNVLLISCFNQKNSSLHFRKKIPNKKCIILK